MKKFLIGLIIVVVFLFAAALTLPSLVPSSVYKDTIQTQLTKELQRDVTIDGDVSLAVFPTVRARTEKVTIANAEGFSDPHFVSMESLEARLKLLPLLSKRVEIKAFELIEPNINLEKRTDGSVNWQFGDPETTEPATNQGPFKRDGRYANIDPSIGKFAIENGAISYTDGMFGKIYKIDNANLAFSLPSLSETVTINGDMRLNQAPVDVNLKLDTPRKFLDGQETPVDFSLATEFATVKGSGRFLEGENIIFDLDLDGGISDLLQIRPFLPELEFSLTDLVSKLDFDGRYLFDGETLSAKAANIDVKGPNADFSYQGDAVLAEKPVLNGNIKADIRDLPKLAAILKQDNPGLALAKTLNLSADFKAEDNGFSARNILANIAGDGLSGEYRGTGTFKDSLILDGQFSADAQSVPRIINALALDLPQAAALGSLKTSGALKFSDKGIEFDIANLDTRGDQLNASFKGTGSFKDALSLSGAFSADSSSLPAFMKSAALDIPQAAALSAFSVKGNLDMSGDTLNLDIAESEAKGEALNAAYQGRISKAGETITLDGDFDTNISSAQRIAQQTGIDFAYSDVIGALAAKGRLNGPIDQLSIEQIDARLSDGQLNGGFTGSAAMTDGFTLNGNLDAQIPSMRTLAARQGTNLPPSTNAGEIYETVSLSGAVTGNPAEINFKNADMVMDDISGKGDFTVDLRQGKPTIIGNVNLSELDLRPYMAAYTAQRPQAGILPWSEEPLNLGFLNSFDGTFNITTPKILMTRLGMGETQFQATVKNGVLTTQLPKLNMYGGLGTLTASLDASGDVPAVAMDVKLDDLKSNAFLGALANFSKLSGEGHTLLEVTGRGRSQADIMRSLDGVGDFKVLNGEIAGIDLNAFMQGLNVESFNPAAAAGALKSGIGIDRRTKFNDIVGLFKIEDGIVSVNNFELKTAQALASGSGKLDLGNQRIDFNLRPRLTGSTANQLASFGIPLKFAGGFNNVTAGLDTEFLGRIAAERAQAEITKRITDQVGGGLGDVVGGILGGQPSTPAQTEPVPTGSGTTEPAPETSGEPAPSQPTPTTPPQPEEVVTDLLGSILGGQSEPAPTPEPSSEAPETEEQAAEENQPEEPTLEDALGSLFGVKKDDD